MKRILAFLLCWTMLLSQLVMLAEAAKMQEQSDILYLEENGIHVEDGGEVFMDNAPLGRSDDVERYAPSIPKFVPEALYNLGVEERMKEGSSSEEAEGADEYYGEMTSQGTGPQVPTYRATISSDKIMMYAFPRADAESVYLRGCAGKQVELIKTDSPVWYYMNDPNDATKEGYSYVYADDISLIDRSPHRGIITTDRYGVTAQIIGGPDNAKIAMKQVDITRAPLRNWRRDGATRTLLASYDISLVNPDGSEWQPGDEPVEVYLTLPEMPELSKYGGYYVEHVDADGKVETLEVTKYFLSNVISFTTDSFSEFFVYCVDYPANRDYIILEEGQSCFFSSLYAIYGDPNRKFFEVVDVSFSAPEKVRIERVYNDVLKTGD